MINRIENTMLRRMAMILSLPVVIPVILLWASFLAAMVSLFKDVIPSLARVWRDRSQDEPW